MSDRPPRSIVAPQAERVNFLRRCVQSGRWQPLGAELLFIVRRRMARAPARPVPRRAPDPPALDDAIHPVFAPRPAPGGIARDGITAGLDRLWAEVGDQLAGRCRLAGGRVQTLEGRALDELADAEDRHAYHRLYWAARYAQAAAFGHPEAGRGLARDWARWTRGVAADDPVAWHSYTCAERCASLVEVLHWIARAGLDALQELVVPLKREVWRAAGQIAGHIEYPLGVHNHLLNDARALYLAGAALPEAPEAAAWRRQAFALWQRYFPPLIRPDGVFAEQSSHYHLLLCRTALEYVLAAQREGVPVPDETGARLRAMFSLADDLLRPDGTLPRFGDSSPDHPVTDLWGLLAAAYAHGLLDRPPRHPAVTPLTLYYAGAPAALPAPPPPAPLRLYPEGGVLLLRRVSAGAADVELAAFADPRPRLEAHGDAGRGSFELWRAGVVLIRDPGNATYVPGPERAWFHSGQAQNGLLVEGLAPVLPRDLQARAPAWYHAGIGVWTAHGDQGAEFATEAFRRLANPVEARRSWSWAADGSLRLADALHGRGAVMVEAALHLGEAPWQRVDGTTFECPWPDRPDRLLARMWIEPAPGMRVTVEPTYFAPEYGVRRAGRVVRLHGRVRLPASWQVGWTFPPA